MGGIYGNKKEERRMKYFLRENRCDYKKDVPSAPAVESIFWWCLDLWWCLALSVRLAAFGRSNPYFLVVPEFVVVPGFVSETRGLRPLEPLFFGGAWLCQ
ncbi:hypothetical protein Ddc_02903 [Ditylenchus destructor]|nr:hypothetical protein Ddc_02903 [Ditylenchus destructor]